MMQALYSSEILGNTVHFHMMQALKKQDEQYKSILGH
jgi:hypothetical protein